MLVHSGISVLRAIFAVAIFSFFLAGCSSTPGSHAQAQASASKSHTHIVAKGETLYSIAFIYGLDYKSLARTNGLDKNYTIYPGQVLHLDGVSSTAASAKSSTKSTPATTKKSRAAVNSNAVNNNANNTNVAAPATPVSQSNGEGNVNWIWPAQGVVMQRYSESGAVNKGIDIGGNSGDPVLAASSGKVVYAGNGLMGYGQLVIIKHNEQMLSAYAHNKQLLVKEGDEVKGGQKIAEIGATGTDHVKLHFEIRRDGKPVDPEQYLPRR